MYKTMASLSSFTDALDDIINDSPPMSLASSIESNAACITTNDNNIIDMPAINRPVKGTGQRGNFRSIQEIDKKFRDVFTYPYFNLIQSSVIDDALYSDNSIVVSAPTGSGKTVVFEMAIVQLLMTLEDKNYNEDFKIIYMAPVKALCTERLTEWYPKFTKLGLLCIEVTGDTDVDFSLLKPYKIIITTPEKWDVLTRRWRDYRGLVEVVKLFMIDEVHILNDELRGPVLEAVVSRMKTIESSAQASYRLELLEKQLYGTEMTHKTAPSIRFIAVSATVSNPDDVAKWLGTDKKPAIFHKFGEESRPVKLRRIVEGYHCPPGTSIFKFDIILNYKLWPIIQKYHCGKPTLIFCNTRKGVLLTAETLSRELTINFTEEQRTKLIALCSTIKNKKLQSLIMSGVGCHHAGLLIEERLTIERGFRNRDLPILITTTTLAMGVNLPAHLVIIKNTQQYVNGAYQEYSMSTVLQMIGRAGRPQFDNEATAVIMTRLTDKARYQALVGGCEPLQSFLHKRLPENLNSEAALGTVSDVAQCVQWLSSTFLYVRAARDPKKYLNLPQNSPQHLVTKKIEDLCVIAMNGLASSGLITMDETGCIQSTEAGRLMSIYYLDLETMKQFMKIEGTESLERLLALICESHELSDMYLRVDERRCLNALNRNKTTATIRFPMKGKITTKQMKLNCIIQAVLGCLTIPDPSLNQEAMKIMRIAARVCKGLVAYVTNDDLIFHRPQYYLAVLNSIILAKCIYTHLWEDSPFVSRQLKGIGPTFSTLLASAGKVNFMLLEESHPRDLERIMNKAAPAGNVIRKQISLLPKYQLSILPIDENTVSVELVLLNQNYLSENIEHLTAGSSHKSYIIVGDSENHILLLTAFSDKDLINVFNGTRTHEVKRKLNNEHKIFAHCISTTFVGIDLHSEYLFNDLNPVEVSPVSPVKEMVEKQTYITDTFRHRKRNCPVESAKTHYKEKKRRVNAIMESFNYLKNTFETASKNIQEQNINNKIDEHENYENKIDDTLHDINTDDDISAQVCSEDFHDFLDTAKMDKILTEIECEMFNKKGISSDTSPSISNKLQKDKTKCSPLKNCQGNSINTEPIQCTIYSPKTTSNTKRHKTSKTKSNYSYVDLFARHMDVDDDDDDKTIVLSNDGFTDTIKCQINKYLQEAEVKSKTVDTNVEILLEDKHEVINNENKSLSENIDKASDDKSILSLTQKLYPDFAINEIQTEEAKSQIPDTKANEDIAVTKQSSPGIVIDILYPNLANEEKETELDCKNKAVTDNNICSIEKVSSILNDKDNLSLTQNTDTHSRTKKIPISELAIPSYDYYTNIVEEVKNADISIIQRQNIYEKKQVTYDACAIKQSNDVADIILYTEKDLNGIFSTRHNNNKFINESQEPIKLQRVTYITKEISANINETKLNELYISKTNTETYINQTTDMKNQLTDTILENVRDIDIKTNNIRDMIEIKQNIVSNNCIEKKILIPNKSNSTGQCPGKTDEENVQIPFTETLSGNLNLVPFTTASYKVSNKSKSLTNVVTMANENIPMSFDKQGSFMVNKSLPQIDISKRDSLICDINRTNNARIYLNNKDSRHGQNIVRSNQTEVDLSDCIVNCDTNHISGDHSETNNESDFSYIATKIGFHNKQSPVNSSLRVVQNVKINFNITEVISAIQCNNEEVTNICLTGHKFNNPNYIDTQNPTKSSSKLTNCNQDMSNIKITPNFNKEATNNPKDQLVNCGFITKSLPYTESSIQKQEIHNNNGENLKDQTYCSDTSEVLSHKIHDTNKTSDIPKITETSSTVTQNKNVNEEKIQDILEKYSTLVRKSAANGQSQIHSTSVKNFASNKIPLKRPRKYFTISEIQKLHVTFPESIIDRHNETLEQKSPIKNQIQLDYSISCNDEKPAPENIDCNNFNNADSELVYKTVDIETAPDNNMDLSLFDPKVLLRSTVDVDDEIIPPPPQFRDDSIEPFNYDEITQCFNKTENCSQSKGSSPSEFHLNTELNYNDTLEGNLDATNLTASPGIETWVLSTEDYETDDHSSLNPAKPFTVIRGQIPSRFDSPPSNKLSIKANLRQYKFNPKNKLRK